MCMPSHSLSLTQANLLLQSLSTVSRIQKCYLACVCLRTRKHLLNLLHYLMCSHLHVCVMFQELQSQVLWLCRIIDTVYSAKFCRCHHGIVIYRHACQHQDSLSSSMAIAKCVAKTCVAEAGFHHAGCLRKHFQKDIVSASACIPALSCCHSTVNGYLSWQGWI